MPHLSQLQREYEDRGVTVIGLTSPDSVNTLESVEKMVADKADVMRYAVAFDQGRSTNEAYMKAARRRSMPTSFLVDKAGKVAWIGHPASADIPLASVVAGSWDYVEGPALIKRIHQQQRAIRATLDQDPAEALRLLEALNALHPMATKGMAEVRFAILCRLPARRAEARRLGTELIDAAIADGNAAALNSLAWRLVDPEVKLADRFLDLAQRAADKADVLSGGENAPVLDTLARVSFWKGDLEHAVQMQRKAVQYARGREKKSFQETLAEYEKALADQGEA